MLRTSIPKVEEDGRQFFEGFIQHGLRLFTVSRCLFDVVVLHPYIFYSCKHGFKLRSNLLELGNIPIVIVFYDNGNWRFLCGIPDTYGLACDLS